MTRAVAASKNLILTSGPPDGGHYLYCVLLRRAGLTCLGAQEEIAAILHRHRPAIGFRPAGPRAEPLDGDFDASREIGLPQAAAQQLRRTAGLNRPVHHRAVRLLDVDVDPPVRVDPVGPGQQATQLDWLVDVG